MKMPLLCLEYFLRILYVYYSFYFAIAGTLNKSLGRDLLCVRETGNESTLTLIRFPDIISRPNFIQL